MGLKAGGAMLPPLAWCHLPWAIVAVIAALTLCGCTRDVGLTQADINAALQSGWEGAKIGCQSRFPVSPGHNHAAYARCLNEYVISTLPRVRYPRFVYGNQYETDRAGREGR
jgi:hypothetical protein